MQSHEVTSRNIKLSKCESEERVHRDSRAVISEKAEQDTEQNRDRRAERSETEQNRQSRTESRSDSRSVIAAAHRTTNGQTTTRRKRTVHS